ncbi:MAG: preQ(1) synthase [Candidatus Omnitrophota bacterium]
MKKINKSYKGLQENIRKLKTPKIDTIENKYSDKEYVVTLETAEFTCVCPKTGLPDFARVVLRYIPDKLCVELKSFKLYLYGYRNVGIFHEHIANKVLDDFISCCKPRWAQIMCEFNVRGGIKTTLEREYIKNSKLNLPAGRQECKMQNYN